MPGSRRNLNEARIPAAAGFEPGHPRQKPIEAARLSQILLR
jgi:hypothetical protein